MEGLQLGALVAFAGGVLSFLSPCVLPLTPPYLAYISGQSIDRMAEPAPREGLLLGLAAAALGLMAVAFWRLVALGGAVGPVAGGALALAVAALGAALALDPVTRRVFGAALAFVLGLATVFVTLGATASAAGQLLLQHKATFGLVAGLVVYALGQHFIGLRRAPATVAALLALWAASVALGGGALGAAIAENALPIALVVALAAALRFSGRDKIEALHLEARFDPGRRGSGLAAAYVIGLAFAFGWTPCIGPILGTILTLASQRETVGEGVAMLSVYAAGLGLPFLLAALFVRPFMRFMRAFRAWTPVVETVMGALLVGVGFLMATGRFEALAFWLLETFPALATIG